MSRRMPDQGRARRWTIAAGLVAVVAAGAGTALAVGGGSGSCALLNDAAMEQLREPGKNLIRRALVERV
ncbi:hypothetical protein SUDANB95_07124 [Actinosynnema sp. ALI-1.44]